MKYCSQCGIQMEYEARYCNKCGRSAMDENLNTNPSAIQSKSVNAATGKSNKKVAILVIAAVCGVMLIMSLMGQGNFLPVTAMANTPEAVTEAFMEAVIDKDLEAATPLCYREDQASMLCGLAFAALTDLSSDYKIRHRPVSYRLIHKSAESASVNVYDENKECFCTVELDNIDGNWRVSYM